MADTRPESTDPTMRADIPAEYTGRGAERITTAEGLDALPVGSVVLNSIGCAWQRRGERGNWYLVGTVGGRSSVAHLPAMLLYRPDAVADMDGLRAEVERLRGELDAAWEAVGGREGAWAPEVSFGPPAGPLTVVEEAHERTLAEFLTAAAVGIEAVHDAYTQARDARDASVREAAALRAGVETELFILEGSGLNGIAARLRALLADPTEK